MWAEKVFAENIRTKIQFKFGWAFRIFDFTTFRKSTLNVCGFNTHYRLPTAKCWEAGWRMNVEPFAHRWNNLHLIRFFRQSGFRFDRSVFVPACKLMRLPISCYDFGDETSFYFWSEIKSSESAHAQATKLKWSPFLFDCLRFACVCANRGGIFA